MRRAILALLCALSLVGNPAGARVLVVVSKDNDDVGNVGGSDHQLRTFRSSALAVLQTMGVDYDLVSSSVAHTEFCRLGSVTYNAGEAGAYVRNYTAVIHLIASSSTAAGRGYRPDSLFSSTKSPLVPQLLWTHNSNWTTTACACSLGVVASATRWQQSTNHQGVTAYVPGRPTTRWRPTFMDGFELNGINTGTVRPLISHNYNAAHGQVVLPTAGEPCLDCDSLASTSTDSVIAYIKQNDQAGLPNRKPIIVADVAHNADDQQDLSVNLISLAMLDSICGKGTIITKPLRVAITIRGGFRRQSGKDVAGGIVPSDSATIKASIDSLASLAIPFTVGVNTDSVASYGYERTWWLTRTPLAHFAPEPWTGVDSSANSGPANTAGLTVDPFGRFRSRFALGDYSLTGADSSLASLVRGALARTDSIFPGRASRAFFPAAFDWSPVNIRAMSLDSLWLALSSADCRAIVGAPYRANSNPSASGVNPLGFFPQQGVFKTTLSSSAQTVRLLASSPYPDSGSAKWDNGASTDTYGTSPDNSWAKQGESFWNTAFGGKAYNDGTFPNGGGKEYDTSFLTPARASVLTIHMGDLGSGVRATAATRPTHPGWLTIKNVVNAGKIANECAGYSVVVFTYPEDIEP